MKRLHNFTRFLGTNPKIFIATLFAMVFLCYGLTSGKLTSYSALAETSKVVSVFADNQKRMVVTNESTVGGVLAKLNVTLHPGDLVEPSSDTKIPFGYFNINVYRARPVVLVDGSKVIHMQSALQSPHLIAQAAGLTVYPEDLYQTSSITNFLTAGTLGERITIIRAKLVSAHVDGKDLTWRTQAKTVGDLIHEKGVALGVSDTVDPGLAAPVVEGMKITIKRVSVATITQTESIPRPVKTVYDNNQAMGYRNVSTAGSDGSRVVTYRIHYNDGVEVKRETLKVEHEVAPVTQVVVVGTKVVSSSDAVALAQSMAASRGWVGDQWLSLYNLWMRESGFNPYAQNGSSGACGIPQAYPCSKIAGLDAAGQINWGLNYIAGKYGTPGGAWAYWQSHHSY